MSITWGSRIVADPAFQSLHGVEAAGAHALRFSINFVVSNWSAAERPPLVILAPAHLTVEARGHSLLVGYAVPEATIPFNVGEHGYARALTYQFVSTPGGMEAIESLRGGMGVTFRLKVRTTLLAGEAAQDAEEEILCRVSQSDWLSALAASGYRKTLLIEVPMVGDEATQGAAKYLASAQSHLLQGLYAEAVASCRLALAAWTSQRRETDAVAAARDQQRTAPKSLSLQQRELLIRQAVLNFAHLAHHADDVAAGERFDREAARMMLGLTASILGRSA